MTSAGFQRFHLSCRFSPKLGPSRLVPLQNSDMDLLCVMSLLTLYSKDLVSFLDKHSHKPSYWPGLLRLAAYVNIRGLLPEADVTEQ